MTFKDWLSDTSERIRTDGFQGVSESAYELYVGLWRRIGRRYNYGVPIYEQEWDILVILDACRYDLMREVVAQEHYSICDDLQSIASLGTDSGDWMTRNFTEHYADEMSRTVHVTGNPHSDWLLEENDFRILDEVWRYAWDDELGTIPARPITDRAIANAREHDPEYLIVHYMQPHHPFVSRSSLGAGIELDEFGGTEDSVWDRLRRGEIDQDIVWEAYRENLKYVLDDIELLLKNVDAETVVISADHGNALGEFGIYGHPRSVPLREIKRIPWCMTSATDSGEYLPKTEHGAVSVEVEERLHDLGYR